MPAITEYHWPPPLLSMRQEFIMDAMSPFPHSPKKGNRMHLSSFARSSRQYLLGGLVLGGLICLSPGVLPEAQAVPPFVTGGLEVCSGSSAERSVGLGCGSDPLTSGSIRIGMAVMRIGGKMWVRVTGAQPLNLYEVYWLTYRAAVSSAVNVGNFTTDGAGDNIDDKLRTITKGADIGDSTKDTNIKTIVGASGKGIFLVYSRGTYGQDTSGDGFADCYNTTTSSCDTDTSHTFANPALGSLTSGTQFVSKNIISY